MNIAKQHDVQLVRTNSDRTLRPRFERYSNNNLDIDIFCEMFWKYKRRAGLGLSNRSEHVTGQFTTPMQTNCTARELAAELTDITEDTKKIWIANLYYKQ